MCVWPCCPMIYVRQWADVDATELETEIWEPNPGLLRSTTQGVCHDLTVYGDVLAMGTVPTATYGDLWVKTFPDLNQNLWDEQDVVPGSGASIPNRKVIVNNGSHIAVPIHLGAIGTYPFVRFYDQSTGALSYTYTSSHVTSAIHQIDGRSTLNSKVFFNTLDAGKSYLGRLSATGTEDWEVDASQASIPGIVNYSIINLAVLSDGRPVTAGPTFGTSMNDVRIWNADTGALEGGYKLGSSGSAPVAGANCLAADGLGNIFLSSNGTAGWHISKGTATAKSWDYALPSGSGVPQEICGDEQGGCIVACYVPAIGSDPAYNLFRLDGSGSIAWRKIWHYGPANAVDSSQNPQVAFVDEAGRLWVGGVASRKITDL